MSLTFSGGPLSGSPSEEVNYTLEGPAHKLMFHPFPRRVRVVVEDQTTVDTTAGKLLYETGILPVFYAPEADIEQSLLAPSEHSTHCPFKGDASYRHFSHQGHEVENLFWHYPEPIEGAEYLRGYAAPYRERVRWFDEDEEIFWHLRDPFQRVDARLSSRPVRITHNGELLAESERPVIISETGLPNRFYVPREDVRGELVRSDTTTHCPYKGDATWHSLRIGEELLEDAAWCYEDPFESAFKAKGMLCFSHANHPQLVTEVDGEPLEQ